MHQPDTRTNPYDVMPYIDLSYVATHPDRLCTMARLVGRQAASLERCRVLEIGCAAGGNILPMAYSLPDAEFVGIDYSQRQIDDGQARVKHLGLDNVRLLCADMGAIDAETEQGLGKFDYIIAHGFYSWTPPRVRDAALALCRRTLKTYGVAYFSYNTYPGWHTMKLIREAMLYHGKDADTPAEVASQGREMVNFLANFANEGVHKELFRYYVEMIQNTLKGTDDSFLLHDELSEVNDPVYFHQFVEHIQRFGFQYLVEVELRAVMITSFKPETQAALKTMIWDSIDLEQKMDFVRNQMFRQTLICHAEEPVERKISPQAVMDCWLRSQARRVIDTTAPMPPGSVQFISKDESTVATNHKLSIVALEILEQEWPGALHFSDLVQQAKVALSSSGHDVSNLGSQDEVALATTLLRANGQSLQLVEVHSFHPQLVRHVSDKPIASAMARLEAESRSIVTNLWHERVTLLPVQQKLLIALDGTSSMGQLGTLFGDSMSATEVNEHMRFFAYAALLVA